MCFNELRGGRLYLRISILEPMKEATTDVRDVGLVLAKQIY
jgi:hypothetical protein